MRHALDVGRDPGHHGTPVDRQEAVRIAQFTRSENIQRILYYGYSDHFLGDGERHPVRGMEMAKLYDSAGDDTFTFDHPGGRFQGLGFDTHAESFERYLAYATYGGYDQSLVYDSAGNDAVGGGDRTAAS